MRRLTVFLAASSLAGLLSACADGNGGDPIALVAPEAASASASGNGGSGPVFASSAPSPFVCRTSTPVARAGPAGRRPGGRHGDHGDVRK
jgi:hypothetical protein